MKKMAIVFLVTLGAAGLYYLFGVQSKDQSLKVVDKQALGSARNTGAVVALAPLQSEAAVTRPVDSRARSGPSQLYIELRDTKDYGATLSRLLAMQGDPHAQYLATLVVGACGLVLPDYVDSFKKDLVKKAQEQASSKVALQDRLALVDREAVKCSNVSSKSLNDLAANRFATIIASAKAGDAYARSELLGLSVDVTPEMRKSLLSELPTLASRGDPFILNNIGNFFSHFNDRQFTFPTAGQVSGLEIATAFSLLACDFGGDCGSNSPKLGNACVRMGRCGIGSVEEYVQNYETTPARFAVIQNLRAALREGTVTGNWPAGLWPQI